ncbi:MAG: aspartate kinase [Draconibacterium sp.]|nr:aspartate kinase [Draconibacterium sp.]
MSNKVIRLGGSHIGNSKSIQNLNHFLQKSDERKFVVVSAIPELLEIIEQSIINVFQKNIDTEKLRVKLNSVFDEKTGEKITSEFQQLAEQLGNLLKGVALIGDYSPSLKDQILSFSEKLSVEILKIQWSKITRKVKVILPEEIGLITTADYGNSTFISVNKKAISKLTESILIIPGSYGITENGRVSRTGKSAADYTAAFLTSELGANNLELWDLDNDFQRADPEIVSTPPVIKRLTYSEASELAYFEHYSFHPRTVEPLEQKHIPIQVINSSTSDGSIETIINTETFVEMQIVKSVACSDDISLLKLDGPGVGLKPGILAKVTTQLNDAGINIKSVITSQTSINLVLGKHIGDKALKLIQQLGFSSVKEISLEKDVSLIGIVGHGMQSNYGVSAKIFSAVASNKINVLLSGSGASDLASYLVVKSSDKEKSVREIYKAFF